MIRCLARRVLGVAGVRVLLIRWGLRLGWRLAVALYAFGRRRYARWKARSAV